MDEEEEGKSERLKDDHNQKEKLSPVSSSSSSLPSAKIQSSSKEANEVIIWFKGSSE